MDIIFKDKCLQIDNHFEETFEVIDGKVTAKVDDLFTGYNKRNMSDLNEVRAQIKEISNNGSYKQETIDNAIRPIVDDYLNTKEGEIIESKVTDKVKDLLIGYNERNLSDLDEVQAQLKKLVKRVITSKKQ